MADRICRPRPLEVVKIKAVLLSQVNRSGYNDMPGVENIAGSMQLPQKANVFVSMCLDKFSIFREMF